MLEIIFFGRGGQGAVSASQILAEAAILGEKYKDCSSFPSFGAERRGAPVEAYCRISDSKIWVRSQIYHADMAVILDETVFNQSVIARMKSKCKIVMNTPKTAQEIFHTYDFSKKTGWIATADLNKICFQINLLLEGQPIVNTAILGAVSKVLENFNLEDIIKAIYLHFGKKADLNIKAAQMTAETACVHNF